MTEPAEVKQALGEARKEGKKAVLMRLKSGDQSRFVALAFPKGRRTRLTPEPIGAGGRIRVAPSAGAALRQAGQRPVRPAVRFLHRLS